MIKARPKYPTELYGNNYIDNIQKKMLSEWLDKWQQVFEYYQCKQHQNNWNKRRSNRFHWRHLWRQRLYCYRFFLSLYMNPVPEMLYYVHEHNTEIYLTPFIILKITHEG